MSDNFSDEISFFGLLTMVFVVLKLCHAIDWKWFWVLSPIIIPSVAILVVVIVATFVVVVSKLLTLVARLFKK